MGLSSVIAVAYWVWIEHCYKFNGWYVTGLPKKLELTILQVSLSTIWPYVNFFLAIMQVLS
jgi:hypothetical protein